MALADLPADAPIPTLVGLAVALEEEVAGSLASEERFALGFLHRLLQAAEVAESAVAAQWLTFLAWASLPPQQPALASLGMVELGHYLGVLACSKGRGGAGDGAPLTIPTGSQGERGNAPPAAALGSKAALLHYLAEVSGPAAFAGKAAGLQAAQAMYRAFVGAAEGAAERLRALEREASEARAAAEAEAWRQRLRKYVEEARARAEAADRVERGKREAARAAAEAAEAAAAREAEAKRAAKAQALKAAAAAAEAAAAERRRAAEAVLAARQEAERRAAAAAREGERARAELEARQGRERAAAAAEAEAARARAAAEAVKEHARHEAEAAAERARLERGSAARVAKEAKAEAARRAGQEQASLKAALDEHRGEVERALRGDDSASIARMAALLEKKYTGWVDPDFPHAPSVLNPKHREGAERGEIAWLDFSRLRPKERGGGVKYVRGSQPRAGAVAWELGIKGAGAMDPRQGLLGDCWLITAFSLFSTRREFFPRVFQAPAPGGSGLPSVLGVRLWGPSGWKEYALDTFVPSMKEEEGLPLYCVPTSPCAMWPLLLEKAFAKHFGGYAALNGGWAVTGLCALIPGSVGSREFVRDYAGKEDVLWGKLKSWRRSGHILGAGSVSGSDHASKKELEAFNHIVKGHSFAILEVKEVVDGGATHRLLQLRNPWGNTEWDGPHGDKWEEWWDKRKQPTSINKRVFLPPRQHPSTVAAAAKAAAEAAGRKVFESKEAWDDGVFYMPFPSFLSHFSAVEVCRVFPLAGTAAGESSSNSSGQPRWHLASLSGVWSCAAGTVGGVESYPMKDTVPRFKLRAPLGADLFIVLRVVLPLAAPPGVRKFPSQAKLRLCIEEAVEGKLVRLQSKLINELQTHLELDTRHVQGGGKAFLISAGCHDKLAVYSASAKADGAPVPSSPTIESLGGSMNYTLDVYSSEPFAAAEPLTAGADAKGKCLQKD